MKNLIFIAFLFLFASQNQYGSQGLFSEIATYFETMLLERKDRLSNIRSENHCLHKILKYNKETMWKRKQGFSKYNQSFEEFIADSKTIDAVIRNFEIIGEAANRLPDIIKETDAGIDWFKIRGLRNRIVHNYFGIDYKIIWTIKEEYLHELITQIIQLLNKY